MFDGPTAPHRPTLLGGFVLLLVVLIVYHLIFHRGGR